MADALAASGGMGALAERIEAERTLRADRLAEEARLIQEAADEKKRLQHLRFKTLRENDPGHTRRELAELDTMFALAKQRVQEAENALEQERIHREGRSEQAPIDMQNHETLLKNAFHMFDTVLVMSKVVSSR
jgi:hypothetical protein